MTNFISIDKDTQEKKETVFTHYLSTYEGWSEDNSKPIKYENVIYLGKCKDDGDMFACKKDGYIKIFKGKKGDEFN